MTRTLASLDTRVFRAAGDAAFDNARGHREAAQLLLDAGHRPRALAFARLGLEELVKAVLYTVAAVRPREERARLVKWRDHTATARHDKQIVRASHDMLSALSK